MSAWEHDLQARLAERLDALWHDVVPGVDGAALDAALADAVGGGKRVRPRLVHEAHAALGGDRDEAVLDAAAAIELLHTAFVVHDDLIDGDDVRRGRPSVPGRFRAAAARGGADDRGAAAYATAGAVLTGDLALGTAVLGLARLQVPGEVRARLVELMSRALTESAAGELADVRLSLGGCWPDADEVLELAHRKTAAYTFVLPLQTGAVLADAEPAVVDALGRAGRDLGIAFQLYDDLAGMFDDPGVTGKDAGADLREGKLTLLVSHARGTTAWPEVARCWGSPDVTEADVHAVRATLEAAGSRAHVEHVAGEHLRSGLAQLREAGVAGSSTTWLTGLLGRRTEEAA